MSPRPLGRRTISPVAFGTMSLGGAHGPSDMANGLAVLDAAWDAGITHFDTANIYGMGVAETVLGAWLKSRPHRPAVATKASIIPGPPRQINNEARYLRAELIGSLKRLGVEQVDLFYLHRRDIARPIEEVAASMADLMAEGLIGGWGLSEAAPATLRRAHAICPPIAVQSEYSLIARLPELGLIQACEDLNVALVAFSPLGRGLLGREDMEPPQDGFRRANPRFQPENFAYNKAQIAQLRNFAQARGWSLPALSVAWVLAQSPNIIALPGTSQTRNLADWAQADQLLLDPDDLRDIARILPKGFAQGDRYAPDQMIGVETYA